MEARSHESGVRSQNRGADPQASRSVEVLRAVSGLDVERVSDQVIAEEAVTVMVDRLGSFTIMATPTDLEALAVGFVFAEGLIRDRSEVLEVCVRPDLSHVVGLRIQDPTRVAHNRNMIVASSCGMCGTRNIDRLFAEVAPCEDDLTMTPEQVLDMVTRMHEGQGLFRTTGGAHAAAVYGAQGDLLALAEDLGRHNALDKAIGRCLLDGRDTRGCVAVLSGRVSLEMVTKAARAGIGLVAAVSAPSSLAVRAAGHWHITLCGFVRQGRLNVYTQPERVVFSRGGGHVS